MMLFSSSVALYLIDLLIMVDPIDRLNTYRHKRHQDVKEDLPSTPDIYKNFHQHVNRLSSS